MRIVGVALLLVLLIVAAEIPFGRAFPSTVPAFLWSPYLDGLTSRAKPSVDYRILSPRDLAKSVMAEGRWSEYLCSGDGIPQSPNFAFLFVGKELRSLDISGHTKADPALIDFLKDSFSNSNFSMAFPYVAAPDERVAIEKSLMSEFADSCQNKLEISNIAVTGSCFLDGNKIDKLKDIHSVQDYMSSRMEDNSEGKKNLIVLCDEDSHSLHDSDQLPSESSLLSELLNFVEGLGVKYTFLYVSDPFRSTQKPSIRGLERFLAEGNMGNGSSVNPSACDAVCQIKSSLLEGILVAIVLLIILISGLCCMAGIDTPTRFETPQES